MGKPSRNAPCPCGSGKKYKKCCLPRDQLRSAENREHPGFFETDLDQLSNSVVSRAPYRGALTPALGRPLDCQGLFGSSFQ
jgi:hypothetical protein